MRRYDMERMSKKYFRLAGNAGFQDKPRLSEAQLPKAAEYAKIVHDAAYALGRILEEEAEKAK